MRLELARHLLPGATPPDGAAAGVGSGPETEAGASAPPTPGGEMWQVLPCHSCLTPSRGGRQRDRSCVVGGGQGQGPGKRIGRSEGPSLRLLGAGDTGWGADPSWVLWLLPETRASCFVPGTDL